MPSHKSHSDKSAGSDVLLLANAQAMKYFYTLSTKKRESILENISDMYKLQNEERKSEI